MPATKFKFSEFVDLLLVRLYDLDQEHGDRFSDLNALANDIDGHVPRNWAFDAGKVMDTRGWADCLFTFGGVSAQITGEGRLYVESRQGLTGRALDHREEFFRPSVVVTGSHNQVVVGSQNTASQEAVVESERRPAFDTLNEIRSILDSSQALASHRKLEAKTYVNLVEMELKKPEPDRRILTAILDSLSKITAIGSQVATLIKFLNG